MQITPCLADLLEQRAVACRLTPDRALQMLDEAESFAAERGMLTLTPDCALPSLFGACHEEPYQPGGHGFASWPKTRWWWGAALSRRAGIHALKLHRGKTLFLSSQVITFVDPLCREELRRASQGAYGPNAAELIQYLIAAGPTCVEDIKRELGLNSVVLRGVRQHLERVGAIVSRTLTVPAIHGGERETSELARWDQRFPTAMEHVTDTAGERENGLEQVVVAGVRAAVVVPQREIASWFSWALPPNLPTMLIESGRLWQPQVGWLAAST
jgi:hypothetical protein